MALTQEFVQAVSQKNNLRVKIMLKDSLLVDTSFNQFNEMLNYAEPRLSGFWVSNDDDDEKFSSDSQELNTILAGLVNNFSHRRVNHLMGMIHKMYPPKSTVSKGKKRESAVIITKSPLVVAEYNAIIKDKNKLSENLKRISGKGFRYDTKDIEEIRKIAMSIVQHCDKITRK